MKTILLISIIIFSIFCLSAKDIHKKINLEIGGAFSRNLTNELPIFGLEYDNNSYASFARFVLQSENRLKMGIESGLLPIKNIYNMPITNQFGTTNVKANLDAIPILLLFSMDVDNFAAYFGMGYYYIISRISAFDEVSISTDYSPGLMFSFDYTFNFYFNTKLGSFVKLFLISDSARTLINFGIKLEYELYEFE